MSQYSQYDYRSAWLKHDFGFDLAVKWFGEDVVSKLPKYVKGQNKGKFKGKIFWIKCTRGGWTKTGSYLDGFVENRVNTVLVKSLVIPNWGSAPDVIETLSDDDPRSTYYEYSIKNYQGDN